MSTLTKADLVALAKENEIPVPHNINKADLHQLLADNGVEVSQVEEGSEPEVQEVAEQAPVEEAPVEKKVESGGLVMTANVLHDGHSFKINETIPANHKFARLFLNKEFAKHS